MTVHAGPAVAPAGRGTSARHVAGLRRASLAALVLLVVQYGIGMAVNLYVAVPGSDHGQKFWTMISAGPAGLTIHIVLGLLLILAAIGLVVRAVIARQRALIAGSAIGLLALIGAAAQGASFVDNGHPSASMVMALLTGVAILSYGGCLYLLASPGQSRP
jgi:hypothetical protein